MTLTLVMYLTISESTRKLIHAIGGVTREGKSPAPEQAIWPGSSTVKQVKQFRSM